MLGDESVDVAVKLPGAATDALKTALAAGKAWSEFPQLEIAIARVRADAVLRAADALPVERIEIIDESMTERVLLILAAAARLEAAHNNLFPVGALNISLGVPKALLGRNRSAEAAVREALGRIVARRIPVVMSIGNDGPGQDTANPWALTPGVIIATATDVTGSTLWAASSRLRSGLESQATVFAAHGHLSVGAWASGSAKTKEMLEAEKKVDLTALVGAGNEQYYRVDSGTSYAAAEITQAICLIHQAAQAARFALSSIHPMRGELTPFVRAYFDSGVDRTHPMFANRLVDQRSKFGGFVYEVSAEQRNRMAKLVFAGVLLDVQPTTARVVEILRRAARPVPSAAGETGHGFVSRERVAALLERLTLADFVEIFAEASDRRYPHWIAAARADARPLFPPGDVEQFVEYCDKYSLIYMLKVL